MSTSIATLDPASSSGSASAATNAAAGADAVSADRFLKLLVAQMENQDPLNPMDNAEITTQMAQINTVTGIQTLNTTIQGLNTQLVQMQVLQGAGLVGHDVTVEGNRLAVVDGGIAQAAFTLDGPTDATRVEIANAAGHVVGTVDLGALDSGRHGFSWDPQGADTSDYSFRVDARLGAAEVGTTPLMLDRVESVAVDGGILTLDLLRSGQVSYGDVIAFN